jgi:NAD(P)-dependent dehydrogenase (short-subunit alcohol dehydrogenase family)
MRPVALVTGASRGIGKACAVALAGAGFDVAIAARTVREGEGVTESPTLTGSPQGLPGSLETTAELVEQAGGRALRVPMDLLDRASLGRGVRAVLGEWGQIDLLLNNAIYTGPGTMSRFLDTPIDELERIFEANVIAPMVLTKLVLPGMLERNRGTIVNMTSAVAEFDPTAPTGEGGWGLGYASSKGAFHRMAGILAVELGPQGILTYNIEPGYVVTERMEIEQGDMFASYGGCRPETIGAAVAWVATAAEARALTGTTIRAQPLAKEKGLA